MSEVCAICRAYDPALNAGDIKMELHIVEVTRRLFDAHRRDIPITLDAVYDHAQLDFIRAPRIRLWAKQEIARIMGWSETPWRDKTDAERHRITANARLHFKDPHRQQAILLADYPRGQKPRTEDGNI